MNELPSKYDISKRDLARGRNLRAAAFLSPVVLTVLPAIVTVVLFVLFGSTPPLAASILFLGLIITAIGFLKGLIISGFLAFRYTKWSAEMRERIAADGIKASEIDWFRKELKPAEKRALKQIESGDPLLGDAYRETLASRLTATRLIRSSNRELLATKRRENKVRLLKSDRAGEFLSELENDRKKLEGINDEAKAMLVEAESRLQLIESASLRGGGIADSELALKRLTARSESLPLALEEAKLAEEIRIQLDDDEETVR